MYGPSQHITTPETRAIPLRIAPIDLRAMLRTNLVVMHAQAAAADVSLTVSVAANVPPIVRLEAAKVGWVIVNLVGNALRYVRHASRRTREGAITVAVTYEPAECAVVIEVRDDGPGIPPATVSRLFNCDDPHGPSGLGLLLVQDIVTAHGGVVEVHSSMHSENHGTSLRLTIPAGHGPTATVR